MKPEIGETTADADALAVRIVDEWRRQHYGISVYLYDHPAAVAKLCELIGVELSAKDAEIEELNQQLAKPRSRSKKQKIEDALRQSDLTAQVAERDDIEYGHHESLPRGEHVANVRKAR